MRSPDGRMGERRFDFSGDLSGLLVVALFQFPAYDMYFDDEKKGEYYKKEAGYLKRGERKLAGEEPYMAASGDCAVAGGVIPKLISLIMG